MSAVSTRARCAQCLRPERTCLCPLVQPVPHAVQLLVLQHPEEELQAKGTGRLLHLCLPASRLAVGEAFEPAQLQALLHAPWQAGDAPRQAVLLYPETPHGDQLGLARQAPWPQPAPCPEDLRLVVLDATWRKSRKMLHLNPALSALPRLSLEPGGASRYLIRKAHAAHQLSTLEAAAAALAVCEQSPSCVAPLLQVFDAFVMQQAACVPHLKTP